MFKFLLNLLVEFFQALPNSKILEIRIPTLFEFSPGIRPSRPNLPTLACFAQQAAAFPDRSIRPVQLWRIRLKGVFPSGFVHSGVGRLLSHVLTAPPPHLTAPSHPAPPDL
jgi:hypothetical protein